MEGHEDKENGHRKESAIYSTSILQVIRPHYEQEQFNKELHYSKPKHKACKFFSSSDKFTFTQCLRSVFPIFTWLPSYSWRRDLVADIITGCTVAIMHIPQGMGYALLANVPPIVGIYMAFFPVLVYFFFGTSRHNSMGTFAVVSIMMGKTVLTYSNKESSLLNDNSTNSNSDVEAHAYYSPIEVSTAVCFIVGLIQLTMYAFRLGVIASLLSDTLISGFTTGAAIHVLTSQIKDLLGISLSKSPVHFELIYTYINIFQNITLVNWVAVGLSATTIVILVINNELLKPRLSKMCSFPVPIELILVLAGTLVSKYLYLETYSIKTLHSIPTGFPEFKPPRMELLGTVLVDSITIAMVAYTVTISMALIFAQKLNYEVDSNQELLAMGAGNVFASFFSCMPFAASLSRSTIQQTVGGKSQIASIISCALLVIVLLWVGPFFEPLPKCVLAGIIVVSLKGMLMQVKQLFDFWKLSYVDAFVWIATFLSVILVSIDIGLLVGIILSLCCIFLRGMKPYACLLGHIPSTDLYLDINRYKAAEEITNVKIFHYCGSINFASRSIFKNELCTRLQLDLAREIRRRTKRDKKGLEVEDIEFKFLILDFSALSYIDPSGVASLKTLINDFHKLDIVTYIAASSCPVYELIKKCSQKEGEFKFFPTVHDAVHHVLDMSTRFINVA